MKKLFIISSLIFSMSTFGQSIENLTPNEIPKETVTDFNCADSLTWLYLKLGFTKNDSICHCRYSLDANSTFKLYSSDCSIDFEIDSGTWEIRNRNTLILKSNEDTVVFQLHKVSHLLFFIRPNEIVKFKQDLNTALVKLNNSASSKHFSRRLVMLIGNKYYSLLTQNKTGT